MSGYSRAVVVSRADGAKATADEAMKQVAALRADLAAHRRTVESRLAATVQLVRREYEPSVRLTRAGGWAVLRWIFWGRLPAPIVFAPVSSSTVTAAPRATAATAGPEQHAAGPRALSVEQR